MLRNALIPALLLTITACTAATAQSPNGNPNSSRSSGVRSSASNQPVESRGEPTSLTDRLRAIRSEVVGDEVAEVLTPADEGPPERSALSDSAPTRSVLVNRARARSPEPVPEPANLEPVESPESLSKSLEPPQAAEPAFRVARAAGGVRQRTVGRAKRRDRVSRRRRDRKAGSCRCPGKVRRSAWRRWDRRRSWSGGKRATGSAW